MKNEPSLLVQLQKQALMAGIKWAIDNYAEIIILEKYGKNPTIGYLAEKYEEYYDQLTKEENR